MGKIDRHEKNYEHARVGELLTFGHYPQGPNDEVEPITWRVLKRDSDSLLVISEKGLDAKPYNEGFNDTTWADCTLRHWLNEEFFNRAFSEQEQSLIKTSNVSNNAGPSTADRIFLLSVDEVQSLFANCKDREAKLNAYAIKNGAWTPSDGLYAGNAWWWLRSRGDCSYRAAYVIFHGVIYSDDVCTSDGSVRPAFRLAISLEHNITKPGAFFSDFGDRNPPYIPPTQEGGASSAPKVAKVSGSPSPGVNERLLKEARHIIEKAIECKYEGDLLTFGRYPQGANGEVKPINWRVLKRKPDSLLIISERGLDVKRYNEQKCDTTWSESTLRRWLNEKFLTEAFSEEERYLIKTSNVSNDADYPTRDRVFLLNGDEAERFFANNNERKCKATDYALKNHALIYGGHTWWWLRSRGRYDDLAAYVGSYGAINRDGFDVFKDGSVRPILQLAIPPTLKALEDDEELVSEAAEECSSQAPAPQDVKPAPLEDYANAQKGDRLYFGRYPQGPNDEVERITWRVLERDSDNLLVVSEKGLDAQPYNDKFVNVAWADCTLRDWLNGEFITKAFNEQEQSMIKESDLSNNAGPPTKDRVFLLSIDEARALFANSNDRRAEPTVYATNHDVYTNDNSVWWWLRSHGNYINDAAGVNSDGSINDGGHRVIGKHGCIRPALRLALDHKVMLKRKKK